MTINKYPGKHSLPVHVKVEVCIPANLQPGDTVLLTFVNKDQLLADGRLPEDLPPRVKSTPSLLDVGQLFLGNRLSRNRPLARKKTAEDLRRDPAPVTRQEYEEALDCIERGDGDQPECKWHEDMADLYEDDVFGFLDTKLDRDTPSTPDRGSGECVCNS